MGQLAKEWQLMVSAEMVALNGGINACQSSSRKTRVPPPSARSRDGKKYVTADVTYTGYQFQDIMDCVLCLNLKDLIDESRSSR